MTDIVFTDFPSVPRERVCCFTGHRSIPDSEKPWISQTVRSLALRLIKRGVTHFITGGALGFDTVASVTLLNMRNCETFLDENGKKIEISVTVAVPCPSQSKYWASRDRALYNAILRDADCVVLISDTYTKYCMHRRNRFMVDKSGYCIAYVTENSGGSYNTKKYAEHVGIPLINIAELKKESEN